MSYAVDSKVPVARSRVEIEQVLTKHGATSIGVLLDPGQAQVFFRIAGWSVRFRMPLPRPDEHRFTHRDRWNLRGEAQAQRLWEQACRTCWRAMLLTIKAKLVSVENKVETFEEAFLAHLVTGEDGATVGDRVLPSMRETRQLPSGLAGHGS